MTPRDRRALLLGLGVVLTAVVVLRAAPRVSAKLGAERQALQARAELLARARAELRGAGGFEDSVAAVRERMLAMAPRILSGGSEAEAKAELTGRLDVLAAVHHVKLDHADAVPDSVRAGRLRRVSLRAYFEADTHGLMTLLADVERGPAVLPIPNVRVMATDANSADAMPEVLKAEVTVRGWYLQKEVESR